MPRRNDHLFAMLKLKDRGQLEELIDGLVGIAVGPGKAGTQNINEVGKMIVTGKCKVPAVAIAYDFLEQLVREDNLLDASKN